MTDYICEDINKANARVLQRVKGIGRAKALAIIAYRDKHGPFQSLDELMKVRGIGSATVENFRAAGFCVKETSSAPKRQNNQPPPSVNDSVTNNNECDNINTASATDLQRVNRIGAVKAQAIVNYRDQNGPFRSLNELNRISGIGPATLENFREAGFCVKVSTETGDNSDTPTQVSSENSTTVNAPCININTADTAELQRVNRIGAVKAQAIIDYRNQNGPFRSLDELTRVRGIGPATLENFRRAGFCVSTPTSASGSSDSHSNAHLGDRDPTENICEDINTASVATFQRVNGIGPVRAQAIIDYRNQFGPLTSMDALLDLKGINPDIFRQLQESGFCIDPFSIAEDSTDLLINPRDTSPADNSPVRYHRGLYGGWMDIDDDCQNTRQEILIAESRIEVSLDETECFVIAGEWYDPYLDSLIMDPGVIDIDHFIPLAEAHRSGGAKWSDSTRYAFGNDLSKDGVLIPVLASVNRSKGQRDPANWLPPNTAYHCQYVDRWVALKETWRLTRSNEKRAHILRRFPNLLI
ncbi:MAG: helix-hairpin-helix domain-containing protein, partial [Bacteroidota bacterium]|nr:helix-hairpin-helix domain-containing protein [Bacteroidota bacterium]